MIVELQLSKWITRKDVLTWTRMDFTQQPNEKVCWEQRLLSAGHGDPLRSSIHRPCSRYATDLCNEASSFHLLRVVNAAKQAVKSRVELDIVLGKSDASYK